MAPRRTSVFSAALGGAAAGAALVGLHRLLRPPVRLAPLSHWRDAPALDDPDFMEILGAALGAPVREGNATELIVDGPDIMDRLLEDIAQARDCVEVLTYILDSGDAATRLVRALEAAAARGVRARLLVDGFGAFPFLTSDLDDEARDADVEVVVFNPPHRWERARWNRRNHRKIAVIDGRIGYTGGLGIADAWMDTESEPWRELHFRMQGPVVADLAAGFEESWRQAEGHQGDVLPIPDEVDGGAPAVILRDGPGDTSHFYLAVWMILEAARERVRIRTPYLIPDDDLVASVQRATERGVTVEFLVPGDCTDSKLVRLASPASYKALLEAGASVREYEPTMMHGKAITADGLACIVGSHNLDPRSLMHNYELSVALRDPVLAQELDDLFDRDAQRCHSVSLDTLSSRSVHRRALGAMARTLAEQL